MEPKVGTPWRGCLFFRGEFGIDLLRGAHNIPHSDIIKVSEILILAVVGTAAGASGNRAAIRVCRKRRVDRLSLVRPAGPSKRV